MNLGALTRTRSGCLDKDKEWRRMDQSWRTSVSRVRGADYTTYRPCVPQGAGPYTPARQPPRSCAARLRFPAPHILVT